MSYGQGTVDALRARAAAGDMTAQFNLARLHVSGTGVPEDLSAAVKWYRLAAEQGHAGAQHGLGVRYANVFEPLRLRKLGASRCFDQVMRNKTNSKFHNRSVGNPL